MIVKMDKAVASSSHDLAQRLFDKNIELENKRRKSAQARVPSDPNAWQQMRENFETIILEDHSFSEKHSIEFALWQLHYRRIEEFRAHYNAASATDSTTSRAGGAARPDRASKIRLQFKTFLSEATGFYHDLILKIRAKYGLPIGQFYPEPENHNVKEKDGKKFNEVKKGLISCHRCLIYLGDLARYKGLYGEGESKSRDYAAASSYYLQAASLWPSSGNPHHQLAILATYSGDELMAVYRYFRSLAAENPFSTARDNLIVAFEKNRQSYSQLHVDSKASSVRTRGRGRGKGEPGVRSKEPITDTTPDVEKPTEIRQVFKAFRVRFVRLNGILFTRTSLETFEEILSLVTNTLQTLLSSGAEDEPNFGTDNSENALFIVILVTILIFTVNNVKGGPEGQTYADIVQNTVLLKNALITFHNLIGQLLKRCLQLTNPSSSFLLPGILISMEYLASRPDVITETDDFWTHCISFFNKLLSAEINDMTRYEERRENDYQPALWEDFETRGFLPLQSAQTFLDFSRKHSVSGDKSARVKRLLAAGKVIADRITVDRKKVRFDPNMKKFVIGIETQKHENKSNGVINEEAPAPAPAPVESDEEDEVIVFRPNLIDNRTEMPLVKGTTQEEVENVQSKDSGTTTTSQFAVPVSVYNAVGQPYHQSPMWPGSLTGGFKGLSLMENGHAGQPGMQSSNAALPIQQVMGIRENSVNYDIIPPSGPDPYIVGRNTFPNMPTSSLKVSTGRPVRHLGPPPGFSSVRPNSNKQVGQNQNQNPVNDDYSWLDGYQLQSSMKAGVQPVNFGTHYMNMNMNMNESVATTSSFPFPGKQVQVQFEGARQQNWPETATDHRETLQQQYVPLPRLDQQGGQSTWKGNQFV
ncbi:hypothetical protein Lser_V15G05796 [Lactuca serriola]